MVAAIGRGIRETVQGLPRSFWILFAGSLVNRVGSFVMPFLVLWLTGPGGLDAAGAGLLASLFGAGAVLAALVGGILADRIGRKQTMLLGLGAGGVAMLALGLSSALPAIAALTFLVAFFSELVRPALQAAVADVVPEEHRPRAYGLLYWGANLGFAIAPIIAGAMATRSWLLLFAADAVTSWAFAAIVLVGLREPARPAPAAAEPGGPAGRSGLAVALRDRELLVFALLSFLLALAFFQLAAALPLDLRAHGVSEARYGQLISLNGLGIIVLQVPLLRAVGHLPREYVLAASSLLVGLGFGLTGLVESEPLYALSILIWTLGEIGNGPLISAVVQELAPPGLRGRYAGLFGMAMGLAHMAAPALGGLVLARLGSGAVWGGCLALGIVVAVGHLLAAGPRRRRLAAAAAIAPVSEIHLTS